MIYILSSAQQIFSVTVRAQESRQGDGAAAANLALNMKQHLSSEVFDEQQGYLNNAAIAAYVSFNKIDQRNRFTGLLRLLLVVRVMRGVLILIMALSILKLKTMISLSVWCEDSGPNS